MDSNLTIKVENIKKIYKLYEKPLDRIKESLNPFGKKYHDDFYALNDVSFEINQGETIGIIGQNGSGKSTLLKILSGVLTPSSGSVNIRGRISALLELGTGFNPELTGVENIYLSGTIMGFNRVQMNERIDRILSFADIGDFINQPVKMYSSGMFARLAFAVAINIDPDILIIDEALSVGDAFFQNKCFHKIEEFKESEKTIIFVSHDISSIKQLCSRVMWLDRGEIRAFGDKESVSAQYLNEQIKNLNNLANQTTVSKKEAVKTRQPVQSENDCNKFPQIKNEAIPAGGTGEAEILSFFIKNQEGDIVTTLEVDKKYSFHFVARFKESVANVIFGFIMENNKGIHVLGINNALYSQTMDFADANKIYEAIYEIQMPKIAKGIYLISPAIASGTQKDHVMLTWYHNLLSVNVDNPGQNLSILEIDSNVKINEYGYNQVVFYETNY